MTDAKSISEEQKIQIQAWADEGAGLSGIQRRLDDEMDIKVTYMEIRFLLDDLAIKMPEDEKPEPEEKDDEADPVESPDLSETDENPAAADESPLLSDDDTIAGKVSVTISELERPGAMASGTVTFGNGEVADWYLDQFGRLGMDPKNPDFKPGEAELKAFQMELQEAAKKKGF